MDSLNQIKDRLYKTAAAMWDLPAGQTEQNFDPLVGLLFGACALEFEKVGQEIETSKARTLEKIIQLLYPQVLTQALPASGIAFAMPAESHCLTSISTQLYHDKKKADTTEKAQYSSICFSPAGAYHLAAHQIAYWCSPSYFCNYVAPLQQTLIKTNIVANTQKQNSIVVALQEEQLQSNFLTFYFDVKTESFKDVFYDYLKDAKWFIGDSSIEASNDFGEEVLLKQQFSQQQIVQGKTNTLIAVEKQINQYYHKKFVTLKLNDSQKKQEVLMPAWLKSQYANDPVIAPLVQSGKIWIEILFPEAIDITHFQENLFLQINCFPVINKQLVQQQYKITEHLSLFPMHTDAYFLDVASITDNLGTDLLSQNDNEDIAAIHYAGVERFSNRAATAEVAQLLQHVKDESTKFGHIGSDFLYEELKQLQQILSKLENKLEASDINRTETPFLILKQKKEKKSSNLFVSFWTTDGAVANNIKAGMPLQSKKSAELSPNSIQFVSNTLGGRAPLKESEKVLAYKTALLNKEKLVTTNDIANYCKLRFAAPQMRVEVKQGFKAGLKAKDGYSKTIDIILAPTEEERTFLLEQGDLAFWQNDLELAIKERSNFFMPIRVFIN